MPNSAPSESPARETSRSRNIGTRLRLAALLALGLASLGGCGSTEKVDYARTYPSLPQVGVLDVQVFRRSTTVEFTNTTAKAFEKGTLWLNRRFSKPIDGIAVGQSVAYRLEDFRDEFGEPFHSGSFFSGYNPERLVMCQLETTTKDGKPIMLGMIVVKTLPED